MDCVKAYFSRANIYSWKLAEVNKAARCMAGPLCCVVCRGIMFGRGFPGHLAGDC